MLRMRHRGPRPLVDRRQSHPGHQPPHPLAADGVALPAEVTRQLARSVPGRLQELRINQPHQLQVQRRFALGPVVETRAADRDQLALAQDRQLRMVGLDHLTSSLKAHRPDAFQKIPLHHELPNLAGSFSTSASLAFALSWSADLPENTR